jgi:hypothetical protein
LTTFGGGDGWLAPGENGSLQTTNNERGLAYNPVTNNLYFTSRSGGLSVRILDPATGAETGTLDVSGIEGGTFTLNKIVVDPGTGTIYGANLRTGSTVTQTFRLYNWANELSTPSLIFDFLTDGVGRVGDNLDLIGTGANAQILAGYGTSAASNANGYLVINPTASAVSPTLPAYTHVTFPEGAGGTNDGDFRLGITYINAPNSDSGMVLGTQGSAGSTRLTSYSGAIDDRSNVAGMLNGTLTLTATTERALDYVTLGGFGLLATLDTSNSTVRLYDFSNPLSPVFLTSLNNTSGPANTNGNSAGDIRFGRAGLDINNNPTITLYALNTNNGLQAFLVTIPEPSSALLLGLGALVFGISRRRTH